MIQFLLQEKKRNATLMIHSYYKTSLAIRMVMTKIMIHSYYKTKIIASSSY